MKRIEKGALLLLLGVALAMAAAGCSAKAAQTDIVEINMETQSAQGGKVAQNTQGVRTERVEKEGVDGAEVIGQVERVVGNEIELALQTQSGNAYTPTGETAAYLIPVGMSVGSGDYSSVSVGMVLGLKLEDGAVRGVSILKRAA